jgi:hypothetical protein
VEPQKLGIAAERRVQAAESNQTRVSRGVGGSAWTVQLIVQSLALFLCWFTATLVYYGLGFSAGVY